MASQKWLDRTQPQTLYMGTLLLYINAGLNVFSLVVFGLAPLVVLLVAAQVAAGWGVANEKKWGYWLAVGVSVLMLVLTLAFFNASGLLTLIFQIALVALLLHPQSREYRKVWFR